MNGEQIYLRMLRQTIGLSPDTLSEHEMEAGELQAILHLCQIHGTGPLIYNELLKHNANAWLDSAKTLQMKQICMHNMLLQTEWEKMIRKCFGALEDGGMRAVLMKGFSYARLYPLSYLRAWGDLDVWVGPEQYHKACGLLREAFPEAKHHDEEWDELKHYCFVFPNGMAIELHRVSMDFLNPKDQAYWNCLSPSLPLNGKENNDSIEVGGVRVPVFEPKYDLLFCFLHSWEHFCGSGIPLKQVCDMALLLQSTALKEDRRSVDAYLMKHLRALHMLDVWRTYGYMACKAMGLPMETWPLGVDRKYGERLYEQVMTEGQCRKKDYGEDADRYAARERAKKMNVIARKWMTLSGRVEKARFLYRFAPRYACYIFLQELKKGLRRTIRGEKMIDY